MKSPFPGMDPFIEGCGLWGDFHDALIHGIKISLRQLVPKRYLIRTGERGYVVLDSEDREQKHAFIPDVNVTADRSTSEPKGGVALAEPATAEEPYSLRAFIEDVFRETFVEILDADQESQLVTCVEVLSPSNKKRNSSGWELYQRKRQGLLVSDKANLVEIDLLRGGERMPMVDPWRASPYRLLVARKSLLAVCRVWPGHFRRPLPIIPVPLLKPDPDVLLDLQAIIDANYALAEYSRSIDYRRPLSPPLSEEDKTWLEHQLRAPKTPA